MSTHASPVVPSVVEVEVGSVVEIESEDDEVVVGPLVEVESDVVVAVGSVVAVVVDVAVVFDVDDEALLSLAEELEDVSVPCVVWPVLVGAVVELLELLVEPWLVPLSSPLQAARERDVRAARVE